MRPNAILMQAEVIVAGQICLDVILTFSGNIKDMASLVVPGRCVYVDEAMTSTGGVVANTGLALHQLGIPAGLIGKLGTDAFGKVILEKVEKSGEGLTERMIVKEGEVSSYSIVLNPSGLDRSFLYVAGASHTFISDDIKNDQLERARFFHFGYPPEMQLMYSNGGAELIHLMKRVKKFGLTTSLDMALPDEGSEAGKVDWYEWLKGVLPHIDIFMPSFDEICYMIDPKKYLQLTEDEKAKPGLHLVKNLARKCLDMGTAMILIKLGAEGIYFQSTDSNSRFKAIGKGKPSDGTKWFNRTVRVPSFKVDVVGTTGAGDCAVAGFLGGMSKNLEPEEVVTMAAAVGAFCVEKADASSGVPHWDVVRERVRSGWETNA